MNNLVSEVASQPYRFTGIPRKTLTGALIALVGLLAQAAAIANGAAAVWAIDFPASSIKFTAEQSGAPFDGGFATWSGEMRFSDAALDQSTFDIRIDLASVSTGDQDRDDTLAMPEWFDSAEQPVAHFVTQRIRREPDGSFAAEATLTIKQTSVPITFKFNVSRDAASEIDTLTGTAQLDRLALSVGTGDWADTEVAGQFVEVQVVVKTNAANKP